MSGTFDLEQNSVLNVAVGQKCSNTGYKTANSGAGGGSFVVLQAEGYYRPLVIAGGAGGDYFGHAQDWGNASLTEFGNGPNGQVNRDVGSRGKSGNDDKKNYNGGAGYNTKSSRGHSDDPKGFKDGLTGGRHGG